MLTWLPHLAASQRASTPLLTCVIQGKLQCRPVETSYGTCWNRECREKICSSGAALLKKKRGGQPPATSQLPQRRSCSRSLSSSRLARGPDGLAVLQPGAEGIVLLPLHTSLRQALAVAPLQRTAHKQQHCGGTCAHYCCTGGDADEEVVVVAAVGRLPRWEVGAALRRHLHRQDAGPTVRAGSAGM